MLALSWFPLLGALAVGGWVALWHDAVLGVWPPAVASVIAVGAGVWLSGCFHEDGLGDSMDGIGGGWTRAQILKIMKDSRVGTYAAVGLALWLHLKVALYTRLADSVARVERHRRALQNI